MSESFCLLKLKVIGLADPNSLVDKSKKNAALKNPACDHQKCRFLSDSSSIPSKFPDTDFTEAIPTTRPGQVTGPMRAA